MTEEHLDEGLKFFLDLAFALSKVTNVRSFDYFKLNLNSRL